jgi:phage terminase large subunit-like protein
MIDWIDGVLSGDIPSCKWVKLAVKRHVKDLKRKDIYFDEVSANRAVDFIQLLPQSIGEFAGQPLKLEGWQVFCISMIFGWKKSDGRRRFKTGYVEIPRKNGKTTLAAAVALYALIADKEAGAQIYFAATKKDQAKICFTEAVNMIKQSGLKKYGVDTFTNAITFNGSTAKPLSADEDTMSGLNTHCAIIDELHEHKTSGVVDLITTSIGSRTQPFIFEITTAGKNKKTVCYEHHRLTEQILEGSKTDDSWFGIIFTIDKEDDWTIAETWNKANPNLFVSKKIEYMNDQYTKASNMVSYTNTFLQLDLNVWTDSHSRWIEDEIWMSRISEPDLTNAICFGGLDLASVRDFSAFVLCFELPDESVFFKRYFWIPEYTYQQRKMNATTSELDGWIRDGHLKVTAGNAQDQTVILRDIIELHKKYQIRAIGFDRHKAETLMSLLFQEEIEVYAFGQGYVSMSNPTKDLEKAYLNAKCTHDGNPVQRWMMGNVLIISDAAENIKIDKDKSNEKVDGAVAEVMAYGTYQNLIENHRFTFNPDLWKR